MSGLIWMNVAEGVMRDSPNSVPALVLNTGSTILNQTAQQLDSITSGLISGGMVTTLGMGVFMALFRTLLVVILTEYQFQFLNFFYRRGVLKRYQPHVPMERNMVEYVVGQSSVTLPVSFYFYLNREHFQQKLVYCFDLVELIVLQLVLYVVVDAWYFFGHRLMHKNKFLWNNIHSKHHEQRNISVYSTAYASFFENLFLIAPPILIVAMGYDALFPTFNDVSFNLAIISQVVIFIVGHCGFMQHPIMYFLGPPTSALVHLPKLVGFGENTQDHEMHHLYPMCNFSLNFTFWDKIFGSYKDIAHLQGFKKDKTVSAAGGEIKKE